MGHRKKCDAQQLRYSLFRLAWEFWGSDQARAEDLLA